MKPACRECWDPVEREGVELCEWCASTATERRLRMQRDAAVCVAWVAVLMMLVMLAAAMGAR